MEPITGFFIFTLLVSITLGTFCVTQIFKVAKKELSQIWKKIVTGIVGLILCFVWYYFKINQNIDLLILTFFGAVGFYDIIIKTVANQIGGKYGSKDNTGTR